MLTEEDLADFEGQRATAVAVRVAMAKEMNRALEAERPEAPDKEKFLIMGMVLADMVSAWVSTITNDPEQRARAHKMFNSLVGALSGIKGVKLPTEH